MNNIKRFVAIMLILVFSVTIVGCGSKTVAKVNDEKITKSELDKRMAKKKLALEQQGAAFTGSEGQMMLQALEKQTLEEMIDQQIILQAAKKEGVLPSKAEITKSIEEIKDRFGGDKEFESALKTYNYTIKELEEKVNFDTAYTNLYEKTTADINVTEDDMKQWFESNKDNYKNPVQITARAILIKFDDPDQAAIMGQPAPKVGRNEEEAKKLAEEIITKLNAGTSFETLAKEKSEDEATKADGGLIKDAAGKSPYGKGTVMPPEFDEAAAALKVGSYSKEPVKTRSGFFIIKLEGLTPEKQLSFEEAKEKIQQELPMIRKQEKFNIYITDLRKKSVIENKLATEAPAPSQNDQLPAGHPPTDQTQDDQNGEEPAKK